MTGVDDRPEGPTGDARALLQRLRAVLVDQEEASLGACLALISRQHLYLEGPPGCGKSLLAIEAARLSGASTHLLAFHRDLRETDLLGDVVLQRRRHAHGERLRRDLLPGPLLEAEVAVLEDLPRAPGEALGPLLRILAERRALGRSLPLESAIATGAAEATEERIAVGAVDPLEPSQLDRFALQVRVHGLLLGCRWVPARQLLDLAADADARSVEGAAPLDRRSRHALQRAAAGIPVPPGTREACLRLLTRLREAALGHRDAALLSDRTFAATVWSVARAHALLRGGREVSPGDLVVLRLMVARRLPAELGEILDSLLEELREEDSSVSVAISGRQRLAAPAFAGEGTPSDRPRTGAVLEHEEIPFDLQVERRAPTRPASVERLMRALVGRIERGRLEPDSDPGGQPRRYRALRQLDELFDGDLIEALLFAEGRLPGAPRTFDRQRDNAGGAIVVLRDVSASMAGQLSEWASRVVAGVVRVASRHRMRVGYVEFHHKAVDHPVAGRLLHRSYARLLELAAVTRTLGQTNYEAPLRVALEGLRGGSGRNRHVVMLTDGLPILGDPTVRRERELARRLGVSVHTVFLGSGDCPTVLDELSTETAGLRFRAVPDAGGDLLVEERA